MKYRPEIDGLRAIAVLPVTLFHAEFSFFSGGYVGVDIFFVISGFLITSILLKNLKNENFSTLKFYERRARRILPALYFVMISCLPFAYMWMTPSQLKDFGQSLISAVFFISNILFWRESGYFDQAAEFKPLLHTWTLAVEEQYYIFFPVFLMVFWRFKREWLFGTIVAIAVISLFLAEWGWRNSPSANFYLSPTRAWELLVGSICAFIYMDKPKRSSNLLAFAGLFMIAFAIFVYDESTPFPSVYTLLPVVGAALILLYGATSTLVGQLLSTTPFVYIGLISYSAYLWHQPLFAFARLRIGDPSNTLLLALSVVSLILAWGTWSWIEEPFRKKGSIGPLPTRNGIFVASAAVGALLVSIGLLVHVTGGLGWRSGGGGTTFADLDALLIPNHGISSECTERRNIDEVIDSLKCQTNSSPKILLWGDSFAMHLFHVLNASEISRGLGIRQIALSQCMPNGQIARSGSVTSADECLSFNNQVLRHIKDGSYDFVIMASPYDYIGRPYENFDGEEFATLSADEFVDVINDVGNTVRGAGATPIFVLPPPANGQDLGNCVVGAIWRGQNPDICNFDISDIPSNRVQVRSAFSSVDNMFDIIDFQPILCAFDECLSHIEEVPLYRDYGHFSVAGATRLGSVINVHADTPEVTRNFTAAFSIHTD